MTEFKTVLEIGIRLLLLLDSVGTGIALAALEAFVFGTQPSVFVLQVFQLALIDGPGAAMGDVVFREGDAGEHAEMSQGFMNVAFVIAVADFGESRLKGAKVIPGDHTPASFLDILRDAPPFPAHGKRTQSQRKGNNAEQSKKQEKAKSGFIVHGGTSIAGLADRSADLGAILAIIPHPIVDERLRIVSPTSGSSPPF
jgi:hypothetical protein